MKLTWAGVLGLCLGVLAIGMAGIFGLRAGRTGSTSHDISGTMRLTTGWAGTTTCYGTGGYDDLRTGTAVTVKDEKGTLIGTGSLTAGRLEDSPVDIGSRDRDCVFTFTVRDVKDAGFYSVEVSRRGGLTYSKADLAAKDWKVEASLG